MTGDRRWADVGVVVDRLAGMEQAGRLQVVVTAGRPGPEAAADAWAEQAEPRSIRRIRIAAATDVERDRLIVRELTAASDAQLIAFLLVPGTSALVELARASGIRGTMIRPHGITAPPWTPRTRRR